MLSRICLVFFLIAILLDTGSVKAQDPAPDLGWEVIVQGIEYQKFIRQDPNNVFVVRMDRTNQDLTLESMIATGELLEGRESVSGMYSRYDQALNFWGSRNNPPIWGLRNKAVVAINGSYYDLNTGEPQGGQIYSGWYSKRFDNWGGWSGFGWKLDRSAFLGECVTHRSDKQVITYPATGNSQEITHVNGSREANELILFTPHFNNTTGTSSAGAEVIVEMTRPTMVLPLTSFTSGFVRQIRDGVGNSPIPFNSIVLSASGTARQTLLDNVTVGAEIQVSQEITPYKGNCSTPDSVSWTKTYASIQGAFPFLNDGQIRDFDDPGAINRNPRTAIAFNDQYIYFIVVDGRDLTHSVGMSIHELALFTKNTLGATSGVAQDGGGSSTMVINGVVVNNTYCNIYTCGGNYKIFLPLTMRNANKVQAVQSHEDWIVSSPAGVERTVANGMLMVVVQPAAYSSVFVPGDQVSTLNNVELRLGPGTNYASISTIPQDTHGLIAEQMNNLEGVQAKSNYWWYVNFNNVMGWVPQSAITRLVAGGE